MKPLVFFLLSVALFCANPSYGQKSNKKILVSGIVSDNENKPVEGALILVDQKNTGISTDNNGFFKLKVKPNVKMIGAFSLGRGSGETVFDGKPVISIVLDKSMAIKSDSLPVPVKEEKVNVGYGTMDKKDLTTSNDQIDARANRFSSYTNIYDMIKGEVPGVQVTGRKILIRGASSLYLSTDPLFVVDGVVMESIDNISPRQVKTITVLKGSETAIYGSRGANGVILIDLIGSGK